MPLLQVLPFSHRRVWEQRTEATRVIQNLNLASDEAALRRDWYDTVVLPVGRDERGIQYSVLLEDIRPSRLLSEAPSKFFSLQPMSKDPSKPCEARVCFPLGTITITARGKDGKGGKGSERTQYIFVKDVGENTYGIMLDALRPTEWWDARPDRRISHLASQWTACARLDTEWPPDGRTIRLTRFPWGFKIGGVQRNSPRAPGVIEDEIGEADFHVLLGKHYMTVLDAVLARREDIALYLIQAMDFGSEQSAHRFLRRYEWGEGWRGQGAVEALQEIASSLSVNSTISQLWLCRQRFVAGINIQIIIKRDNREYPFRLSRSALPYSLLEASGGEKICNGNRVRAASNEGSKAGAISSTSIGTAADEQDGKHFSAFEAVPVPGGTVVAVTMLPTNGDRPRLVMPLGTLRDMKDNLTSFFLARDLSGSAGEYLLLFTAQNELLAEEEDPDMDKGRQVAAELPDLLRCKFSCMRLCHQSIQKDKAWIFTADVLNFDFQGYRVSPVVLVGDKLCEQA